MTQTQVVLITGASSGIGYAAALAFARTGSHVVATARRLDRLETLAREVAALPAGHGEILALEADVQSAESMRHAVEKTLERFGRLDVLVANAGVGQRGSIIDASWEHLESVLRTNIDGVLHSIRAAVPAMRQQGGGHIIIISSVMATMPAPFSAVYAGSKAFVSNLARSLRFEFEADNIWVTDMMIGQTHSEFAEKRLGKSGRVASKLPTMTAGQVADGIVRASRQRKKTIALRWLDRVILFGNTFTPGLVGLIVRRLYR
jgi:short-subunit dehydrogenase